MTISSIQPNGNSTRAGNPGASTLAASWAWLL